MNKKEIDVKDYKRLGKSYITSLYRHGCDEVQICYTDKNYLSTIQELISKETTGFEIVKHGNNFCVIKDLTGHTKDEFNTALRRIWLLTIDLAEESLNAVKKRDENTLKNIPLMDYSINKFSNYCLRLLMKKGYINFQKTPAYYYLIRRIEEIADKYKDLSTSRLDKKEVINEELLAHFAKVNEHLKEYYALFYDYKEETIEDLFKKTKTTMNKLSNSNSSISYYLSSICEDIRNLLTTLIEIQV